MVQIAAICAFTIPKNIGNFSSNWKPEDQAP